MTELICSECGSVFIGGRGAPKACSPDCSRSRRLRLQRERRAAKTLARLAELAGCQLPLRGIAVGVLKP